MTRAKKRIRKKLPEKSEILRSMRSNKILIYRVLLFSIDIDANTGVGTYATRGVMIHTARQVIAIAFRASNTSGKPMLQFSALSADPHKH